MISAVCSVMICLLCHVMLCFVLLYGYVILLCHMGMLCVPTGGAFHSALQNNNMEMWHVDFVNNTAGLDGGSVYIGESHTSVFISAVSARESYAESGGGIFLDRFSTDILIFSCDIVQNSADVGGGLVSFADRLTVQASTIDNNEAVSSYGGMWVEDTLDFLVLQNSIFSGNVAGSSSGGGLRISMSVNITIESCEFVENEAVAGSGGALSVSESQLLRVLNTSFVRNSAALVGGATYVDAFSSQILFVEAKWQENSAGGGGGALYVTDSDQVEVNGSVFSRNIVRAGCGSAIYVKSSYLAMSANVFSGNRAFAGGTFFWLYTSGMDEPAGLRVGGNEFDHTNAAGYGPHWATEAHHLRLLDDQQVYLVTDYAAYAPVVGVHLQDVYDQVVASDSSTMVTVAVPPSQIATCDSEPGSCRAPQPLLLRMGLLCLPPWSHCVRPTTLWVSL